LEIATIQIGNLIIGEPMTAFTDIIIACTSFLLVGRIRNRLNESFFNNNWRMFFLFMGISTSLGTIAHALNGSEAISLFNIFWMGMILSSSVAVFFSLQATIRFMRLRPVTRKWFEYANQAILLLFFANTLFYSDFEIFKFHAAAALSIIFSTHLVAWSRQHNGSGWIVGGMLLSFLTVFIHSVQFSLSRWFNYKDISHVIMVLSLVFIYTGIRHMSENLNLSLLRLKTERDPQ